MSIENHVFSDGDIFGAEISGGDIAITVSFSDEQILLGCRDVKAMAFALGLVPDQASPEEVEEIERLVASSSRLNNGG